MKDPYWAGVLSAVVGGVVVVAASVGKLFKFHESWLQYRAVVEALEREKELYSAGAATLKRMKHFCQNDILIASGLNQTISAIRRSRCRQLMDLLRHSLPGYALMWDAQCSAFDLAIKIE